MAAGLWQEDIAFCKQEKVGLLNMAMTVHLIPPRCSTLPSTVLPIQDTDTSNRQHFEAARLMPC